MKLEGTVIVPKMNKTGVKGKVIQCILAFTGRNDYNNVSIHLDWVLFLHSDVDECMMNVGNHACDENAICTNTDGSYTCKCHIGYAGDGYNCTYGEGNNLITEITEREFQCLWCGLLNVVINFLHTSMEHADDMIAKKFSVQMSKNLSHCIIIYMDMILSRTCIFHEIESGSVSPPFVRSTEGNH